MTREAYSTNLGDALKRQRVALGLTQKHVAIAIGVSESAISLWESGKRAMDAFSHDKLRRFFSEERKRKQNAERAQAVTA